MTVRRPAPFLVRSLRWHGVGGIGAQELQSLAMLSVGVARPVPLIFLWPDSKGLLKTINHFACLRRVSEERRGGEGPGGRGQGRVGRLKVEQRVPVRREMTTKWGGQSQMKVGGQFRDLFLSLLCSCEQLFSFLLLLSWL